MLKKMVLVNFLFYGLVILSGCASYKSMPLNRLTWPAVCEKDQECISFGYKIFSSADCKMYLDRDVIHAGYQPVHITLTNNTNRYLFVSPSGFSLPCASVEQVAEQVHTSTITRATSYGLLGLIFWPFLIPAIIDGIKSSQANRRLDLDFETKTLKEQVVGPYTSVNGLIFVPVQYFKYNFTFAVTDIKLNKKIEISANPEKVYFKRVNKSKAT